MKKQYLTTQEVKVRYGIKSSVTLHNWRKKRGFPEPISGRYYSISHMIKWEAQQYLSSHDEQPFSLKE